eukprot:Lithocolla_globosa_v1_NODE_435_length_4067_cov_23.404536.p1 type:complete len:380 gc:universal NODE_435_length_4067_cov_23.404536:1764-625(-)
MAAINVFCRIRPQTQTESQNSTCCVEIVNDQTLNIKGERLQAGMNQPSPSTNTKIRKAFRFRQVLPDNTSQQEMLRCVSGDTVSQILNGYNASIIAYGQTGSGKTFTVNGLLPICYELLQCCKSGSSSGQMRRSLQGSYLEIYNEKVKDLLHPESDDLEIVENDAKIYVRDMTNVPLHSKDDIEKVLKLGQQNRFTASTDMNEASSRSHSIFIVSVLSTNVTTGKSHMGQLYLVDLAGSETISPTCNAMRQKEGQMINKSLLALGQVVHVLSNKSKKNTRLHIPYRNSKLTRILKNSFGGDSRASLVVCISDSNWHFRETLSTLNFGVNATKILNEEREAERQSGEELRRLLETERVTSYGLRIQVLFFFLYLNRFKSI